MAGGFFCLKNFPGAEHAGGKRTGADACSNANCGKNHLNGKAKVRAANAWELKRASQKVSIKLYTDMAVIAIIDGQLIFKISGKIASLPKSSLLIIFS